jgi:hypothetical protein
MFLPELLKLINMFIICSRPPGGLVDPPERLARKPATFLIFPD